MHISNFTIEEFGKNSYEPYIPQNLNTNYLNTFIQSAEDKSTVTVLIVNSLFNCRLSDFSSAHHISWAMEFLGHAFSLPLQHHKVISKAFKLYNKWIFDLDRPPVILSCESFYQQEILCHLSLLFTERGGSIEVHSKLCKKALIFMKELAENTNLTKQTWQVLLKILLLISNSTLTNMKALSQHISPFLLTVLFEIWIKSNTRDIVLWKELESNSALWLDHIWFVNQWKSVVLQLTRKVVEFIYGDFNPTSVFRSSVLEESKLLKPGESFTLTLDIELETVLFMWHKFLSLMINNTKNSVPSDCKVHKELSESMEEVIDVFLDICDQRNSKKFSVITLKDSCEKLQPLIAELNRINNEYKDGKSRLPIPSGNSILHIFGDWLFYHAEVRDSYSEFGNGPAIGSLCKILCKAQGPINQENLSRFYKILESYFTENFNQHTVGYMMKNSQELFSLSHVEIRLFAFNDNFLNCIQKIVSDPDNSALKKHCCGIISSIIGLNSLFGNVSASKILKEIFLIIIKQENEPENFKKIIWSMAVYAATEKEENSIEIAEVLVNKLQEINYITQRLNYNMLIECVNSLPYTVDNLTNSKSLIKKLCNYLRKVQTKNVHDTHNLLLICIFSWWACYPKNFDSSNLQDDVLNILESDFLSKPVKESAEFVKEYIQQSLLQCCSYSYTKITCDIINTKNTFNLIKHFIYKSKYIISIYNCCISECIKDTILCILRNSTGKYVWSINIEYPHIIDQPINLLLETIKVLPVHEEAYNENIDITDDEDYDKLTHIFDMQAKHLKQFEEKYEENYEEGLANNCKRSEENKSYRLLLSQFGLYQENELKELMAVDNDMEMLISSLDEVLEKKMIFIPIYFLNDSHSNVNLTGPYSSDYLDFLNSIGIILTEDHKHIEIFSKISNYISKYKVVIYTSDALNEVMFLPLGISNLTESEAGELSELFIVWNERKSDKYSNKIPVFLEKKNTSKACAVLLVPDSSHSVKVKKFGDDNHGPLLDGMNVSISVLPKLLIRTFLNENLTLCLKVKAKKLREEKIKAISDKLKNQNELVRKQKVLTFSFLP